MAAAQPWRCGHDGEVGVPAMVSGVILVVAFGVVAALGLALAFALFRITGRTATAGDSELGRTGPEGS